MDELLFLVYNIYQVINLKQKTVFVCNECGNESGKWLGKCPACGAWNSMTEERVQTTTRKNDAYIKSEPLKLSDIELTEEERFTTGISEFDRVLGGGIVRGSLVLVGGDPGIGKSTLLTQMCQTSKGPILYVSGEESQKQIKIRAERLGINNPGLMLLAETNMEAILGVAQSKNPAIMIVDSVQTVYMPELTSAPGSVSQVREVTINLMRFAKERGVAIFLVGHVTKEGTIAGPRVLEHMVDCVLYFEGERHHFYRVLRGVKNRFGSTNEIGVFEMCDVGLKEVENPSKMLLEGRPNDASGSCVICTMEGTRPILAEVQALISTSGFNMPRRMATGVDQNRVAMLMAVLEKRVGMNLANQDAYVNVIGGIKVDEPGADLGLILAIASSFRNKVVPHNVLAVGEVGLTGEIRAVNSIEKRINEAAKLGFETCIVPKGSSPDKPSGINILEVSTVREALAIL